MKVTPKQIETVYDESNAVEHYLSKSRRDGVKIEWEEPFSCSVFKRAIALCNKNKGDKLKIFDVGSGTGDGYVLLSKLFSDHPDIAGNYELDYLGVDISPQMTETARNLYANHSNARFECADIRTSSLREPFDIYLSCGVPYSHLTNKELHQALKMIGANVRQHRSRCAVVVDVLGRYSIEWIPQWQESRWNYSMSFFESEGDAEATWMSFYSHDHLQEIMQQAMDEVGCPVEGFEFFDRSIIVGRHTSTGQFNPKLPQYRNLVNNLLDSSVETDLSQLVFSMELGPAPEHILDFFGKFSGWWNTLVSQAAALLGESLAVESGELPSEIQGFQENVRKELSHISNPNVYRQKVELMLAETLRCLEATQQPGYGVGHDLFGVMWLDASKL